LRRICDHLAIEKNVERAIQLIAINSCYSGSSSRLYVGRFHKDLELFHFASFGFDAQAGRDGLMRSYERKFLPLLMGDSIQLNTVTFLNHDASYLKLFSDATGLNEDSMWRTTVILPLLPNYFATLSIQIELMDEGRDREYFDALRSVINLYLTLDTKASRSRRVSARIRKENRHGPRLTERQELILELIQEGKTNANIAHAMGYSESLIRQESIAIYRKLGIEGRKDLSMQAPIDESNSGDELEP
jgi:DNA-binding CsgD family transcriptional regulator